MPTLSELAKTQQTTTVGQAQAGSASNAGGTSIQPVKQIDNSAGLMKDIGKMFGNVLQEHQQASEYAGKTVGTDNLVEYKKKLSSIANMYAGKEDLSSSDMVEKSRLEQGAYEEHMQKGHFGDNELANEGFKNTYANPATDALFRAKGQNEANRVALFKDETKREVAYDIDYIGSDIDSDNINTFKQQFINAGLDSNLVDDMVIASSTNSLETEINSNHSLYYDKGGNLNTELVDKLISSKYKNYTNSKNEAIKAEITRVKKSADAFLGSKAKQVKTEYTNQAMNRGRSLTWDGKPYTDKNGITYKFAGNYKSYEQAIKKEFPLLTEENHTQVMNLYRTKSTSGSGMSALHTKFMADTKFEVLDKLLPSGQAISKKMIEEYNVWNSQIQAFAKSGLITESKAISAEYRMKTLSRAYTSQQKIFNDMQSSSVEDSFELSKTGGVDSEGNVIKGDDYRKQYSIEETNISQIIDIIDMDTNDVEVADNMRTQLYDNFDASVKSAGRQGKSRPAIFNRYDTMIKDVSGVHDLDSMQKAVAYIEYSKDNGNNTYSSYGRELNILKQVLYKTDANGELLPKDVREQRASVVMQSIATDMYRTSNDKAAVTTAKKAVNDIAVGGGEGFRGVATIFDTPVPESTHQHVMKIYKGSRDDISVRKYVSSFETVDVSKGALSGDTNRVFVPKSLTANKFEKYIDTILKVHNKGKEDKLKAGDVEYIIGNDGVDITYRLLDKTNQRHIGNISGEGYQFLLGTGEMSDVDTRSTSTSSVIDRKKDGLFLGD